MTDAINKGRIPLASGLAVVSTLWLAGCMGPTYGTDTPSGQQLVEDVTGILSLRPDDRPDIDYTPRPELVEPESLQVLPPPQQDLAANSEKWPESPEQRLARVREEATLNQDNNLYRPAVSDGSSSKPTEMRGMTRALALDRGLANPDSTSARNQREEFNRRLAERQQGSPTQRRYLSEPPIEYRRPAETAPVGDVGEDEWRKERHQRASDSPGWRGLVPWL